MSLYEFLRLLVQEYNLTESEVLLLISTIQDTLQGSP